jgi:anti-sigma regulatory factor (Ser/Thr protein kinase)
MSLTHGIFIYDDDDTMLQKMAPFLESGLERGEAAVVVVARRKWELLADALGPAGKKVSHIDCGAFYTRPEDALAGYDLVMRQLLRDGASAVRAFAELPRCEAEEEWSSWIAYEAIVNRALEHHPFWVMCGYDRRELPEALIEGGLQTHQHVLADGWERNAHYRIPERVVAYHAPPPTPLRELRALPVEDGPRAFRERLSAELSKSGVPEYEAGDIVVAAGEVLANAQLHGGERVSVGVGCLGDQFVCEISDDGPGIDDPLAGYVPPRLGTSDGAGLWVARQLTRRLELVPTPGRFSVRLWAAADNGA